MRRYFKTRSIYAQQLYNRLRQVQPGDIITYGEMNDLVGMKVQAPGDGYGYLNTARNMCLRNDRIVFRPVHNVGLERLTDNKIAEVGYSFIGSVQRKSKKGISELTSVKDFEVLSNDEKIRHNTALSILGVFASISKSKKITMLENKVKESKKSFSFEETIKLFE